VSWQVKNAQATPSTAFILWTLLPSALPPLAALLFLEVLLPSDISMYLIDHVSGAMRDDLPVNTMLMYGASALFHIAFCLIALLYAARQIMYHQEGKSRRTFASFAAVALCYIVALVFMSFFEFKLYVATFYNITNLLQNSSTSSTLTACYSYVWIDQSILPERHKVCTTTLSFISLLLISLGILAVLMVGTLLAVIINQIKSVEFSTYRQTLPRRLAGLRFCFYLLSGLLITSTITTSIFFYFPIELVDSVNQHRIMFRYALSLSVLWGVIYALILITLMVKPLFVVSRKIVGIQLELSEEDSKCFTNWLAKEGFSATVAENGKLAITGFAPLPSSRSVGIFEG
jgi:hypothetical protein